jgi:uncharacterized protein (TIGR00290 family)
MASYMNWSGGKDSALALYHASKGENKPGCLSTNINKERDRISMHGVRRRLLEAQAASIGLPLYTMDLREQPGMEEFEEETERYLQFLKGLGYTEAVFGDIFLEDLKAYREKQLDAFGISCSFPLWKKDSSTLMNEFIDLGFKAIVVCVNESFLDKSFCGRMLDKKFIHDLPAGIDVCGENGEYHSFVFDGPLFSTPVSFIKGEIVRRNYKSPKDGDRDSTETGFYFCDLLPLEISADRRG